MLSRPQPGPATGDCGALRHKLSSCFAKLRTSVTELKVHFSSFGPCSESRMSMNHEPRPAGETTEEDAAGFLAGLWFFLRHNKKWWLTPIIVLLLLLTALVVFGGSGNAPFRYTIF